MMTAKYIFIVVLGLIFNPYTTHAKSNSSKQNRLPNIVFILADDLGYGELGCYGQKKIETPNIDNLASRGMRFTQFYSGAPVCAPARCVLMTGKHTGHSYIRGNDEWASRGKVWDYRAMEADSSLEGQTPLPESEITMAQLLKNMGYQTGIVGKWGLGAPHTNSTPNHKGFDFFFGYNCQRQAHTYYPLHLWKNNQRVFLNNDTVAPGTRLDVNADPYNLESYKKFTLNQYSPDLMFREITTFVNENKNHPFFLYWATTIPHAAIQAPQNRIDYYVKKFGDEKPYLADMGYFPQRYPHAAYAAMVSYLDDQVGKLIGQLKELGIYENTLIFFTSDNGPTFNGGTDSQWFNSAGPFRCENGRGKGFVYEGGIRVPMIAAWPGKIREGVESDHLASFADVLPTLCEITGAKSNESTDGISFLPSLTGKQQKKHQYLYWEFPETDGQQAVRMGQWKAVRRNISKGNLNIELYNLSADLREEKNVAADYPKIVREMEKIMAKEHITPVLERFRQKALGD